MGLFGDLVQGAYNMAKAKNDKLQDLYDKLQYEPTDRLKRYAKDATPDKRRVSIMILKERGEL